MIADPFVQLRLLELQEVDTTLRQLAHRRASLPELAVLADCDQRSAALDTELVTVQTLLSDLSAGQSRLEADIDSVRKRASKDLERMASSGTPAKEITGLQHEVASLARRQGVLEDELLELMQERENAESVAAALTGQLAVIESDRAAALAGRDAAFAEIDGAGSARRTERTELAAGIPADLLALYEKVAAGQAGVGAAMLRQRRCEGCRLELAGNELSEVRNAKPDEVLRCENCRRILVRSAESGL